MKGDYQSKIMKFPKETIVKSMCFTCLNPERVFNGCLDFEIDKKQKEINNLEKKHGELMKKRESASNKDRYLEISIEVLNTNDKINRLYDEIFKLQNQRYS